MFICFFVTKLFFPSELSAAGAKRGVSSLPMRTVPSRRSTQAQPAEGRPGPSDDDDDNDDNDDDENDNDDSEVADHVRGLDQPRHPKLLGRLKGQLAIVLDVVRTGEKFDIVWLCYQIQF